MKSPNPSISIIVPIYNREQWLSDCLDSILAQTFTNWECILVDDGSTDNSLKIAQEYAANNGRFIVFSQENQGVSAARNLGLDHAQGKWLAFVDSDDEIAPDYLEILYKLGEDNNADLVNASIEFVYDNNQTSSLILKDSIYNTLDEDFENYFYIRISGIVKLYRLAIIKLHNLRFDTDFSFAEDYIFTFEFYRHAQRLAASSKAIYKYNRREDNHNQLYTQLHDFRLELEVYNKLLSFYEQMKNKFPQLNEQLIYKRLALHGHMERLIRSIESKSNSIVQRYQMYRCIKSPIKSPIKASPMEMFRYYLLFKQQYFLFALSRIWVNRH